MIENRTVQCTYLGEEGADWERILLGLGVEEVLSFFLGLGLSGLAYTAGERGVLKNLGLLVRLLLSSGMKAAAGLGSTPAPAPEIFWLSSSSRDWTSDLALVTSWRRS